jgi:ubiquinone/menaquinone biosynthesis C-methylase UbiE
MTPDEPRPALPRSPVPAAAGDADSRDYFRKIHETYQKSAERGDIHGVHERIKKAIGPQLGGLVLDIGSSGVPDFQTDATRTVISFDYVFESLRDSPAKAVWSVAGDMHALPFAAGCLDRIIIQYVIHYVTEKRFGESLRGVRTIMAEMSRTLKKGGSVHLVDSTTFPILEIAQRALYGLSFTALKALDKPMVYIFSAKTLCRLLADQGLAPRSIRTVEWGEMRVAGQSVFPGLRFPLKYTPVRCRIITAVKS